MLIDFCSQTGLSRSSAVENYNNNEKQNENKLAHYNARVTNNKLIR